MKILNILLLLLMAGSYACTNSNTPVNCDKEFSKTKEKLYKEAREMELKSFDVMWTNNKICAVGDRINLMLAVEFDNGEKWARYGRNYPATLDYSNFDDSLSIHAQLLKKRYHTYPDSIISGKIDTIEITFQLKIISLSNPDYATYLYEKYKVGDTFDFHLSPYGRPIMPGHKNF